MRARDVREATDAIREWRPSQEPKPLEDRHFFSAEELQEALRDIGPIDPEEFFEDIDAFIDPAPREWFDE